MRHWQPIVVDIPTMVFEPRPTPPTWYVPDIECDGWSTPNFTIRLASVRGYSHRFEGRHRQDAMRAAVHPSTGCLVMAVADGVSAAPRSHEGAAIACETSVAEVMRQLGPTTSSVDWAQVLTSTGVSLTRYAERMKVADAEAMFATTLVVTCLWPTADGARVALTQVGDSSAWMLRKGRYERLLSVKGSNGITSGAVQPLPRIPDPLLSADSDLVAPGVLLIGTDGFGDPLGDGSGAVGELFADALATPPPPLGFAQTLDFSRETFDDDRTLIAVWPTPTRQRPQ